MLKWWRNFLKLAKESKKALSIQVDICKSLGLSSLVKDVCVNICTGSIHVHASAVPLLGTNKDTLCLLATSYTTFWASVAVCSFKLFFFFFSFIIFSVRPQSAIDSTDFCNDSNQWQTEAAKQLPTSFGVCKLSLFPEESGHEKKKLTFLNLLLKTSVAQQIFQFNHNSWTGHHEFSKFIRQYVSTVICCYFSLLLCCLAGLQNIWKYECDCTKRTNMESLETVRFSRAGKVGEGLKFYSHTFRFLAFV